MGLDASIPLQVRPLQLPDFNALAQERLSATQNVMAMQQQAKQLSDQNSLRQVYSSAVNPQTGEVDSTKLLTGLAQTGRGDLVPQVQATLADAQAKKAQATKAELETHIAQSDQIIHDITSVSNPVQAVGIVRKYQAAGTLDPDKANDLITQITAHPENWKAIQADMLTKSMGAKDQLTQMLENQKFAYQQVNDTANRNVTMRGQNMTSANEAANRQVTMRGQNMTDARAAATEADKKDALFTPDAVQAAVQQLRAGDKSVLTGLGRGNQGATNIAMVRNELARQLKAEGASGATIASANAAFTGQLAAARAVGSMGGKIDYGVNELAASIPLAQAASAALPRGTFVPATKIAQMIASGNSDPKLKDLLVKTNAVINAYNMVAGRAGTSVDERAKNASLLRSADSPQAYQTVLNAMNMEGTVAKGASAKTMADVTGTTHAGGTLTKQGSVTVWTPH